jgi:NhaP-type Na+/H+ or K+/H+ antiporter
MYGH